MTNDGWETLKSCIIKVIAIGGTLLDRVVVSVVSVVGQGFFRVVL